MPGPPANTVRPSSDAAVDPPLHRHLLESEIRRSGLMLGAVALLMGAVLVMGMTGEDPDGLLRERMGFGLAVLGALGAFEGGVGLWLRKRRPTGRPSPGWFRFLQVLLEVSVPTVAVLGVGRISGIGPAVNGVAPFVYFLIIGLTTLHLDGRLSLFAGAAAAVQMALLGEMTAGSVEPIEGWAVLTSPISFRLKAFILLLSGGVAAFVARQIRGQVAATLASREERDRAVSMFGQHVSPQVADLLLKQPVDYSGEQRSVCIMFLDIRDFSRLAGERSAPEVVEYLNALFAPLIRTVNDHGGIVNKFLGDGFMAVFGAPMPSGNPCGQAVEAALSMLDTVETLSRNGTVAPTRIGIGLHVGEAVTGNVGSSERKEYTIIGDVVNLASRIEQATKAFGAKLLVSEPVLDALGHDARTTAEDLGPVELKGQARPARLFKLA